MAKRKTSVAKVQPAVESLYFATPNLNPGYNGTFYIDLARAVSEVNRRAYRQGRQWMVAGITFASTGTGQIVLNKIPVTWMASNAWEKTFRAWDKQQMDAIKEAGAESAVGKFRDFKIGLHDSHYAAKGTNLDLRPIDSLGNQYNQGEWDWSEITLPNAGGPGVAVDYSLVMCGGQGANTRAMIRDYGQSRARVEASTPDEGDPQNTFFADMFDVGSSNADVIANATDRNDDAPYDRFNYPGGSSNGPGLHIHGFANIVAQTTGTALGVDVTQMHGGCFPCGLMEVNWTETENNANLVVQVHLVPGPYRGYLAPPMTEM